MSKVKAIPEGYSTITPYLTVRDAARAIEFYAKAFGAREIFRMPGPGGSVMHAEIQIGNSILMLSEENPAWGALSPLSLKGTPFNLHLYVEDVDKAFKQAISAGCTEKLPVQNMFWGDRYGKLTDPFGHEWGIATHKEDVAPEEMEKRAAKAMSQGA